MWCGRRADRILVQTAYCSCVTTQLTVMTLVSVVSRFFRLYVFSTEMLILAAFVFVLYNFVPHVPLWNYMRSARVKMRLRLGGQNDTVPNGRKFSGERTIDGVFEDKERASWELRRDNVGVFAIQGRRPHMEDRFNVVSNLENTGASIYGIFDGHGGEVWTIFRILLLKVVLA